MNTHTNTYVTEDGVKVAEGDLVYDYYSMEQVIIGEVASSDGWFTTLRADGSGIRSQSGMLNGSRICTLSTAKLYNYPNA
jgi:hypothetical protein